MWLGRTAIWALASGFLIEQTGSAASLTLFARQIVAVGSAANGDRIPTVAILLHDAAGISPTILRKVEAIATNVFGQAGVQVRWIYCSRSEAEHPPGCQLSLDALTVTVKVLPDAASRQWGLPANRLGFCLDKDVFLLIPAILDVAEQQALPIGLVLGHALVHEAGHAILGPGHSRGVMRSGFRQAEWRQAEKGQLLFANNDAHRIRERLVTQPGWRCDAPEPGLALQGPAMSQYCRVVPQRAGAHHDFPGSRHSDNGLVQIAAKGSAHEIPSGNHLSERSPYGDKRLPFQIGCPVG